MNPFILDSKTRLQQWKQLREQIKQTAHVHMKLDTCLEFWKQAPEEHVRINWDDSQCWPGAWNLMYENAYCTSCHSLGIAYTLMLADEATFGDLKLMLMWDKLHSIQKIVVRTHDHYLNVGFVDKVPVSQLKNVIIQNTWEWRHKQWITTRPK